MKLSIIAAFLTGAVAWMAFSQMIGLNDDLYRSKIDYTKYICDKGHNEISGDSEELCGRLQDETNTEYLCNQTGGACWLEVK